MPCFHGNCFPLIPIRNPYVNIAAVITVQLIVSVRMFMYSMQLCSLLYFSCVYGFSDWSCTGIEILTSRRTLQDCLVQYRQWNFQKIGNVRMWAVYWQLHRDCAAVIEISHCLLTLSRIDWIKMDGSGDSGWQNDRSKKMVEGCTQLVFVSQV